MNKKLKIGFAGAGGIAAIHYDCMRLVYGLDFAVEGIADVIPERAASFASARGIRAFADLDEMLACVDAVDVCTPPFAHADVIVRAARAGKAVMCEKPLIGYAPEAKDAAGFDGLAAPKEPMLRAVIDSAKKICAAVRENGVPFTYFENFVYTPQVQKEAEVLRLTKAQILRMTGEEAHKGNLAAYSSEWKFAGGGSLISTGSHPLGAMLYLKRVEGIARKGKPIRPASVTARIHTLTKNPDFVDKGFLRCDYHDVEDYGWAHVVFEDGTVGDAIAGATVLGGVNDYVEVFADSHRSRLAINPMTLMETYNPGGGQLKNLYTNCMASTNEGWIKMGVDENTLFGYRAEMQDALECAATGREPLSGVTLAADTIATIYAGYLSAERGGHEVPVDTSGW
jgi:predicted dehydrogenase